MEETKSVWASKTFWGGVIALLAGVLGFFGYQMGAEDQQAVIELVSAIVASIGGAVAIVGRVKASKKIGK